jgi:quercetin dioxygenase-like cupin family protein
VKAPLRYWVKLGISSALIVALTGCANLASSTKSSQAPSALSTSVTSTPLLTAAERTILDQLLQYPSSTQAQVSSSIITIPVGIQTGLHRHDAPMYAYILEGDLTVTYDGGTVKTYHPGEAMIEAIGTSHNGVNNGTIPVKVLVVNMGAAGVSNTVTLP